MIILFTLSYPYTIGKEETFIENEIELIHNSFEKFIIIPTINSKEKYNINFKLNINTTFFEYMKKNNSYWHYLFNIKLYYFLIIEICSNKRSLIHPKKTFLYILNILKVVDWIKKDLDPLLKNEKEKIVLYTFWFTHINTALCYYYKKSKNVSVVTRAHGIDLYEFRNKNYIPLREFTIKYLKKIYLVSEQGREYINNLYPKYKNKYYVYPIGVRSHGKINKLLNYEKFHIVSCSNVDKNKNVGLILDSLINISNKYQSLDFIWTHFGNGVLLNDLIEKAKQNKPQNLKINFVGYKNNIEILEFYEKVPVNVFITTSLSEGGRPLSIQEAMSFGIPIIATNVGGVTDIVNNKNGFLVSPNPDLYEVTDALETLIKEPELWSKKRKNAYKTWDKKCNSDILTQRFIDELKSL